MQTMRRRNNATTAQQTNDTTNSKPEITTSSNRKIDQDNNNDTDNDSDNDSDNDNGKDKRLHKTKGKATEKGNNDKKINIDNDKDNHKDNDKDNDNDNDDKNDKYDKNMVAIRNKRKLQERQKKRIIKLAIAFILVATPLTVLGVLGYNIFTTDLKAQDLTNAKVTANVNGNVNADANANDNDNDNDNAEHGGGHKSGRNNAKSDEEHDYDHEEKEVDHYYGEEEEGHYYNEEEGEYHNEEEHDYDEEEEEEEEGHYHSEEEEEEEGHYHSEEEEEEGEYHHHNEEEEEEEEGLDVGGMWKKLGCDAIFKKERPVHSQAAWNHARKVYRDIVGKDASSIADDDVAQPKGFTVPIEAKQSPPKGRGIFALTDIKEGTLIWSTKKTARFATGPSYREFIFGLEVGFACDVLQWAYVQEINDEEVRVSVDLDEGCFCNDGKGSSSNLGCKEEEAEKYEGGCRENYFALRDIKAGEELQCDYSGFVEPRWGDFGL